MPIVNIFFEITSKEKISINKGVNRYEKYNDQEPV